MIRVSAYIGIGSNLDSPERRVRSALDELARLAESRLVARSALYVSAPVGAPPQPDFVNAVAQLETGLAAEQLLAALQAIEARHGRVRSTFHGPRTLDLDLLLYADAMIDVPHLTVPHPRMHERAFVLRPLVELNPALNIPGQGPARDLLARCETQRIAALSARPAP